MLQVRTPDQPKDCKSARPQLAAGAARPRGQETVGSRYSLLHCISPLLAQSGHPLLHRTSPLSGLKRTLPWARPTWLLTQVDLRSSRPRAVSRFGSRYRPNGEPRARWLASRGVLQCNRDVRLLVIVRLTVRRFAGLDPSLVKRLGFRRQADTYPRSACPVRQSITRLPGSSDVFCSGRAWHRAFRCGVQRLCQ